MKARNYNMKGRKVSYLGINWIVIEDDGGDNVTIAHEWDLVSKNKSISYVLELPYVELGYAS